MDTARAKEPAGTLTAPTSVRAKSDRAPSWRQTVIPVKISTSASNMETILAALIPVSTPWARHFAPAPTATCLATTGRLVKVIINIYTNTQRLTRTDRQRTAHNIYTLMASHPSFGRRSRRLEDCHHQILVARPARNGFLFLFMRISFYSFQPFYNPFKSKEKIPSFQGEFLNQGEEKREVLEHFVYDLFFFPLLLVVSIAKMGNAIKKKHSDLLMLLLPSRR